MRTAAETGNITDHYDGGKVFDIIFKLAQDDTEANLLGAAELLLHRTGNIGAMTPDMQMLSTPVFNSHKLQQYLFSKLFKPVFKEHGVCMQEGKTDEQISSEMNHYKSKFIKLMPYMFILNSECARTAWKCIAYRVWHNDIERLRNAETFTKEDVDTLLLLKRLAPPTKDYREKHSNVIDAMESFFRFTQQDPSAAAFIEETMELSKWIDSLCQPRPREELKRPDEAWQQKDQSAAGENFTASSALAEGIMPTAIAHPAVGCGSMEASGCHLHMMEQQLAPPPVEPLTDLVGTPAPATLRLLRQPIPAIACVSMTQPPPVASGPNPVFANSRRRASATITIWLASRYRT